nr:hypothetical protein Iba_chr02cCG11410 [Ipomoea batatas]
MGRKGIRQPKLSSPSRQCRISPSLLPRLSRRLAATMQGDAGEEMVNSGLRSLPLSRYSSNRWRTPAACELLILFGGVVRRRRRGLGNGVSSSHLRRLLLPPTVMDVSPAFRRRLMKITKQSNSFSPYSGGGWQRKFPKMGRKGIRQPKLSSPSRQSRLSPSLLPRLSRRLAATMQGDAGDISVLATAASVAPIFFPAIRVAAVDMAGDGDGYSKVLDQKEAANEESSSRRLPRTITRVVVGVE